jgi:hypothetical protein
LLVVLTYFLGRMVSKRWLESKWQDTRIRGAAGAGLAADSIKRNSNALPFRENRRAMAARSGRRGI